MADIPKEIKLTRFEEIIFDARLTGISFCNLDGNDLEATADNIILQGAAITGCNLPNTDFFANIISGQLIDFVIKFGYGVLTPSEIIIAMQINERISIESTCGVDVERIPFTGNCFNISYLSKVLGSYMMYRTSLDRRFQNLIDGY